MKITNRARYIVSAAAVSMAVYLVTQGQGCSPSDSVEKVKSGLIGATGGMVGGGSTVTDTGAPPAPADDVPVIPNTKTVSVTYSNQILEQFSSCLGVRPSDRSIAVYETKKGTLSTYGNATSVTSPMMMSIVSVSGELCQDLIDQEIQSGSGRIFKDVSLGANTLASPSFFRDAISRLALSCWQRKETTDEANSLVEAYTQVIQSTEASANRKAALMICTTMMASFDGIAN